VKKKKRIDHRGAEALRSEETKEEAAPLFVPQWDTDKVDAEQPLILPLPPA
jgi:hypothetical protein